MYNSILELRVRGCLVGGLAVESSGGFGAFPYWSLKSWSILLRDPQVLGQDGETATAADPITLISV